MNVIDVIKAQHQQIKGMLEDTLSASGEERERLFKKVKTLMGAHEAAEEAIVHPVSRNQIVNGDSIVAEHLIEEDEARTALSALEKLRVDSAEFQAQLTELKQAVVKHAESEESKEYNPLATGLGTAELERMGQDFEARTRDAGGKPSKGKSQSSERHA